MVGGDQVTHAKPNPEIFLLTAKKLKTKPSEIIVIEDSTNGFKAAKAAGMKVIAKIGTHNKHEDFSLANETVTNLKDLNLNL